MSEKHSSEPLRQVPHACLIDVNYTFAETVRPGTSYPGAARKTFGKTWLSIQSAWKKLEHKT